MHYQYTYFWTINNDTCTDADAICPLWSKSRLRICVNLVAFEFMQVLALPNASKIVFIAFTFSAVNNLFTEPTREFSGEDKEERKKREESHC